jgi:hypothetical protein
LISRIFPSRAATLIIYLGTFKNYFIVVVVVLKVEPVHL